MNNATANKGWLALVALATAQFLMVLDQSVMNVSIGALVHDFHTTVTTIQAVITLYCLVMAMLILTGAKIGDMIGRRRAFVIGLIIYACGSALTALSQSVAVLALGWSVLEGIGASLVFPALAALIAGNFAGARRKTAYAVIGGDRNPESIKRAGADVAVDDPDAADDQRPQARPSVADRWSMGGEIGVCRSRNAIGHLYRYAALQHRMRFALISPRAQRARL